MDRKVTILDGGMGRELERMGAPFSQPLWSAQALIEDWRSVFKVHNSFATAGANVITTNAYALVPHHMGEELYQEQHDELLYQAAGIASRTADDFFYKNVLVAGCVPPVFGSYRPDLFDADKAQELIEPFFKVQAPDCDLWIAETVSSMEELRAIKVAYDQYGRKKRLWVAFTLEELNENLDEPLLRSDEKLRDVLPDVVKDTKPSAILFNCCPIENILPAVRIAKEIIPDDMEIGAYANAFTNTPKPRTATITSTLRNDVSPEFYLEHAKQWVDAGATIVGGCCGIGPEHIKLLAENL